MAGTVHLTVTGMTCGGCESAVTRAVKQIGGVRDVKASHAANTVDVTFDEGTVTPEMIRERIERLGYRVTV
jgi:copper chaperone CopZ